MTFQVFSLAVLAALTGLEIADIMWDIRRGWKWAVGKHIFLMSVLLILIYITVMYPQWRYDAITKS